MQKKIFDEWINKVGTVDKEELISITIIKGINKEHPYWYKVAVSINEKVIQVSTTDKFFQIPSRFLQMTPKTPENLNNLIYGFKSFKKYSLFPASMDGSGRVDPFFDKGILKTSLKIKDAWEIGENDLERAVIQKDDNPIIPDEHKDNAPILVILKANR